MKKQNRSNNTVELSKGIFWVGSGVINKGLGCNPYLIIDGEEGILIDPGSVLDFKIVFEKVTHLIDIKQIKYIILHHQDPDFCASVPLFEQKGLNAQIVTHWRSSVFIQYYGVKSPYYTVDQNNYQLSLKSGRILKFILSRYLHFPGAFITWDEQSGILFTSDLFGAFGDHTNLFADSSYIEGVVTFHEHYMPSHEILRATIINIENLPIEIIAPQHGCIINENIPSYMHVLKNLECGFSLQVKKRNLLEDGGYDFLCNTFIFRFNELFSDIDWKDIFSSTSIKINPESLKIIDHSYSQEQLWNVFFESIFLKKGILWLTVIEPMITKDIRTYNIPYPLIFQSQLILSRTEMAKKNNENIRLKELTERLEDHIEKAERKISHCPITGLRNEQFFRFYINEELQNKAFEQTNPFFLFINIDNMPSINLSYGKKGGNEAISAVAYTITDTIKQEDKKGLIQIYKLEGSHFLCYFPKEEENIVYKLSHKIRTEIEYSKTFYIPLSVSIAMVSGNEFFREDKTPETMLQNLMQTGLDRAFEAQKSGGNTVFTTSLEHITQKEVKTVCLIDNDSYFTDILSEELSKENIKTTVYSDGDTALNGINQNPPDCIIADYIVPIIQGLEIRKNLFYEPHLKKIPFILVSHKKNEESIIEAYDLKVDNYLHKPVSTTEVICIVKNLLEKR